MIMSNSACRSMCASFVLGSVVIVAHATAAAVMVDFDSAPSGATENGFTSQSVTTATYLVGGATVTVNLASAVFFDRGATSITSTGSTAFIPNGTEIGNLQRDFALNSGNAIPFTITATGVPAGTHPVNLWFADTSGGSGFVPQKVELSVDGGPFNVLSSSVPGDGAQSAPFAFTYTTNGTGPDVIRVTENNDFGQTRLNGFAMDVSVPEPTSLGLLAAGAAMMLRRNRKRTGLGNETGTCSIVVFT